MWNSAPSSFRREASKESENQHEQSQFQSQLGFSIACFLDGLPIPHLLFTMGFKSEDD